MVPLEDIVLNLNELLEDESFRQNEFERLINQVKDEYKTRIIFLDFEYYNEFRLRLARREKIKNIKLQNFETAATFRDKEKECQSYISIRTEYKIMKSTFYYDQEYLFYFHLGNAKNDNHVKMYFKKV